MQAPWFWETDSGTMMPALLAPTSAVVAGVAARRARRAGWRAPVPVICCGNATVGGAGKTTVTLDFLARLAAQGLRPHALTRGYGGTIKTATRVDPAQHGARDVGDEALLLAALAPCWVGADRAASARAAVAAGAGILVMDDGLQNFTLTKTLSVMVIDGAAGFGNGRVLPAGPLREKLAACAARCAAAVLIGPDQTGALAHLPEMLPVLRAVLVPGPELAALQGQSAHAFAGIGRPGKFFEMLDAARILVTVRTAFADHHAYRQAELMALADQAQAAGALCVTTPKDFVRIPPALRFRFTSVGVSLAWRNEAAVEKLLAGARL